MNNTLNEFKKNKINELQILSKLKDFIEFGENLGVEIDKTVKAKLLNATNEISTEKLKIDRKSVV